MNSARRAGFNASEHRPQLCVGTVRHKRLRPAVNAFSYRVYQLRLPMRTLAAHPLRNAVLSHNRFNLLSFHDADHGDGAGMPLLWIDALLHKEGVDDADGEIWLHTFPRVLGYVFNPVSFWFCERADGSLRAIVCEVNNTFGERHCYLLARDDGRSLQWGEEVQARKVFHVSPFCKVEGVYRFRFMQALRRNSDGDQCLQHVACIDHDDAVGPLLLTSVSGDTRALTTASTLSAFFSMPAMTIGVIARIHWQALRLFWLRVPFFRKPDPPSVEVSR